MKNSKPFTFRLSTIIRKRVEALGYKVTRFIHEAMLEKLAREETTESFGTAVHMQAEQNIKEGKPLNAGLEPDLIFEKDGKKMVGQFKHTEDEPIK